MAAGKNAQARQPRMPTGEPVAGRLDRPCIRPPAKFTRAIPPGALSWVRAGRIALVRQAGQAGNG